MKRVFLHVFLFLLMARVGLAEDALKMVFVYPGGEGTTEDAQPLIDQLFQVLQQEGTPPLSGQYLPSKEAGQAALQKLKPELGVVSLDFYLTEKGKIPMRILLATQPLASKSDRETYQLLVSSTLKPEELTGLAVSREVHEDFIKKLILQGSTLGAPDKLIVQSVPNMVTQLKKISQENLRTGAMLDSFEYAAFKKMKLAWTQNLKVLHTATVPSAPLVTFTELPPEKIKNLQDAFTKLSRNPQGQAVLESLRLRGFALPDDKSYLEAEAALAVKAAP